MNSLKMIRNNILFICLFLSVAQKVCALDPKCGPNALMVVAQHFNIEATEYQINQLCGYDPVLGTTFKGLVSAAKALGLYPVALQMTSNDLSKMRTPSILWVNNEHYFVVHKSSWFGRKFLIEDPPNAPELISKTELEEKWHGEAIVFSKDIYERYQNELMEMKKKKYFAPKIYFDETVHFFGTVAQGDTLVHVFNVINIGSEPLMIKARSTCTCIASLLSNDTIMPGESGMIKIAYNTENRRGHIVQAVTIRTNDPTNSSIDISLSATIRGDNKVIPNKLFFNKIRKGSYIEKEIKVIDPGDGTLEIDRIITPEYISTTVLPAATDAVYGRYIPITISMKADIEWGDFEEEICIYTDNQNAELIVEAYGSICGDYIIAPSRLFYDASTFISDQNVELTLTPIDTNSPPIMIGENSLPVTCQLIKLSTGGYKLLCSFKETISGVVNGTIPIVSEKESYVIAEIPVYARFVP